jgi:zinc protease
MNLLVSRLSALLRGFIPVLLAATGPAWAAATDTATPLPEGVQRGAMVEGVEEFRLRNGLTVLLAPDPGKATITVNVTYRVGSRNESYGETGMAHLLEHLMFKGTPDHPDIAGGLTRRGMRPNGTTWFDRTNYFETFAASEQNLSWALEMEADRMVHSNIARSDLDTEMTVVRNEMERGENSPDGILSERTIAAAFQWHNYGKSTIGARADVENVSIDRLQAFYRTWYQPDNAVLVVAGRIEVGAVLRQISQVFGRIPLPSRALPKTYTLDPPQEGERLVVLRRPGDLQYLDFVYHGMPAGSADFQAFQVLASLLGDPPYGRLHQALTTQGLATSTGAHTYALLEPGLLECFVTLRRDQSAEQAEARALAVIEGLAQHPVTDQEVERVRTRLLSNLEQTFADPERFGVALSGAIAAGDWRLFFLAREDLRKVTAADVQRVGLAWLKPSNRTLGRFVPSDQVDRPPAPAFADVASRLSDFHPEAQVSQGEAFDPAPASIERQVQRSTLAGGLKLALLPKRTRGHTVSARLQLHWGTLETLKGQADAGHFATSLLDRGGAGLSREEIREQLDRAQAKVSISGGASGVSVAIDTVREHLPEVLALVGRLLHAPTFPQSEFNQFRTELLASLEEGRKDPQSMSMHAIAMHFDHYPRDDIRHSGSLDEDLDDVRAVSRDQVVAFQQRFFAADHGEFAVVGDFDPVAVTEAVRAALDGWTSREAYAPVNEDYAAPRPARLQLDAPGKANAFFYARMPVPLRDDDADVPLLTLANYILGEGFLNSRLATRIRQKEGLSYGVGSFLQFNRDVPVSTFGAYAIYAPENRTRLEQAFKEELARVLKEGYSNAEVDAARQALLQSRRLGRAQDGGLASLLAEYLRLGRTMAFSAQSDARIEQASAEELLAAVRRHIDPEQLTLVFAGDFSKLSAH